SERVRHLFATCSLIGFWLCVCSPPARYSERVRYLFATCSPPVRYLFATANSTVTATF
ncbi:hypothetical protein L195_g063141, partial [Trifolium pratense]